MRFELAKALFAAAVIFASAALPMFARRRTELLVADD